MLPSPGVNPTLIDRAVQFSRELRSRGIPASPDRSVDFLRALQVTGIQNRSDVRTVARTIFSTQRAHEAVVDAVFDSFWGEMPLEGIVPLYPAQPPLTDVVDDSEGMPDFDTAADPDGEWRSLQPAGHDPSADLPVDKPTEQLAVYSRDEILRQKDFSQYSDAELEEARRLMGAITWEGINRQSRRKRPRGLHEVDMRRLIRQSMKHGGEIVAIPHRGRRRKRRRLILICDVSGSMEIYTRVLLQFLHSLASNVGDAEVFIFGTRLSRITPYIRRKSIHVSIAELSQQVLDWSGGTRIGDVLGTFNRHWARRVGGHGALVVIISDGWDRGPPEQLQREIRRLARVSYHLIWLNPLLGSQGYEPLTRGMQAALPFIDEFLPVNNMASLEELAAAIRRLNPPQINP